MRDGNNRKQLDGRLNTTVSVIALNVNGLITPIKRRISRIDVKINTELYVICKKPTLHTKA